MISYLSSFLHNVQKIYKTPYSYLKNYLYLENKNINYSSFNKDQKYNILDSFSKEDEEQLNLLFPRFIFTFIFKKLLI